MVMGTLANIYAIQQSLSTTKQVNKDIISADLIAHTLNKQQLNNNSKYIYFLYFFHNQI
jgi:hypothetical protein